MLNVTRSVVRLLFVIAVGALVVPSTAGAVVFDGSHAFQRAERLRQGAEVAAANGRPLVAASRLRRSFRAERRGFRRQARYQFRLSRMI